MNLAEWKKSVRERLEAATPGPWTSDHLPSLKAMSHVVVNSTDDFMVAECYEGPEREQSANVELIAHAPTDLRTALAVIQTLTAALEYYGNKKECWFGHCDELSTDLQSLCDDEGKTARQALERANELVSKEASSAGSGGGE